MGAPRPLIPSTLLGIIISTERRRVNSFSTGRAEHPGNPPWQGDGAPGAPPPNALTSGDLKRAIARAHQLMARVGEHITEPIDSSTLMQEERR